MISSFYFVLVFCIAIDSSATPAFPIKIDVDRHMFIDQNGQPFFINGDTAWSLIATLSKPEVETYLKDRQQKGFNAIIVNLIEALYGGPDNVYGVKPFNRQQDFSRPNEQYFDYAEWIIQRAEAYGIVVFLAPAYLGYICGESGWCQALIENGPEKCLAYGRYLGQKFAACKNIIWLNGGDAEAGRAIRSVRAIVEGITETNPDSLHTAHCYRNKSATECFNEPWLDINAVYSDCSLTAAQIAKAYKNKDTLPFFYIEGRYENENTDIFCLRRQAYWAILGGAAGHFFGNYPIWHFAAGWNKALNSKGAMSMVHFNNLFKAIDWYNLIPDNQNEMIVDGSGPINSIDYVSGAVSKDGNLGVIYFPSFKKITVDLSVFSQARIAAYWINPSNGNKLFIRFYPNRGLEKFTPPYMNDWVLLLSGTSAAQKNVKQPQPMAHIQHQ